MVNQKDLTPEQVAEMKKKLEGMSPEEIQEMVKQQCVFCKIIAGEVPCYKVYEDAKVLSFLDIQPATAGHIVVIPKKHYSVLPQIPDDEAAYLFTAAKQLAGAVFDSVGAQGITIMQNNGAAAGQTVPHVRVHIIPRYPEDKLGLTWKPQEVSEEQFGAIQNTIASKASSIKINIKSTTPKPTTTQPEEIKPAKKQPKVKSPSKPKNKTDSYKLRLIKP